jgi:arylsulfatase
VPAPPTDGLDLTPIIDGRARDLREFLFAEYHPRKDASLYNQTIVSKRWRYTRYPDEPAWGELFDLEADPWEHLNLFAEPQFHAQSQALDTLLRKNLPPMPLIESEVLGAY